MDSILTNVADYYSQKVKDHGATPSGVDWNSSESQENRFTQLLNVCNKQHFSVFDYGCGYGALLSFLRKNKISSEYFGFDVSKEMIATAQVKFESDKNCFSTIPPTKIFNYTVASGIFNVRLNTSDAEWLDYILKTIEEMDRTCDLGFSFNALTKYSDKEFMKDYLYYADPLFLFDHCKKNFSKNVALLHDYNLYEFTILIRK